MGYELGGKFFINQLQNQQGTILMRGRILGPVAGDFSPYYLCDLFPGNDNQIGITSQTILSLDQLSGVYLYEDKPTQDAAWLELRRHRAAWVAQKKKEEEAEKASPVHGLPSGVMLASLPEAIAKQLGLNKASHEAKDDDRPVEYPDKDTE